MIRRILLPLDHSEYCKSAFDLACRIAKLYDADIIGLVVLDIPGIEKSIGPVPLGASFYAKKLEKALIDKTYKHIENLLNEFNSVCESKGIKHWVHERQGIPSDHIIEESKFYDLLVIGTRTFFTFESEGKGRSLEKILKDSVTPILAVPKNCKFPYFPKEKINCLICFDGEIPASRSLLRYGRLTISKFSDIKIVMSHQDKEYSEYQLREAKAYLKSHLYENIEKIYTTENIIKVVKYEYLDWADMIVAGVHNHKGLLDAFVGSLTKYLIRESDTAIFIGF